MTEEEKKLEDLDYVQQEFKYLFNPKTKFNKSVLRKIAKKIPWPVPAATSVTREGDVVVEFSKENQNFKLK